MIFLLLKGSKNNRRLYIYFQLNSYDQLLSFSPTSNVSRLRPPKTDAIANKRPFAVAVAADAAAAVDDGGCGGDGGGGDRD